MSSSTTQTAYTIGFGNAAQHFNFQGEIMFDSTVWSDEQAFAFLAAFQALPWPNGVDSGAQVQKVQNSNTTWVTDLATNPPSFT